MTAFWGRLLGVVFGVVFCSCSYSAICVTLQSVFAGRQNAWRRVFWMYVRMYPALCRAVSYIDDHLFFARPRLVHHVAVATASVNRIISV